MTVIQTIGYAEGGIADFIRSCLAYFTFCKKNDIKYYYYFPVDHSFSICFKKHLSNLPEIKEEFCDVSGKKTNKTDEILNTIKNNKNENYLIRSNIFEFVSYSEMKENIIEFLDFFSLSSVILNNMSKLINDEKEYVCIQVRCGDSFMEKVKNVSEGVRINPNSENLFTNIDKSIEFLKKEYKDLPIYFLSDNDGVKEKNKGNKNINVVNSTVRHTAYITDNLNDEKEQYNFIRGNIDAVSEFFLLGRAKAVVGISRTGFTFWSTFLHQTPLYRIDNGQFILYKPEDLIY